MSASLRRSSFAGPAAFALGVPLGIAVVWLVLVGPWRDTELFRYVEHPVEQAELILFCCAFTGLVSKLLSACFQRRALQRELMPRWNGQPVAASDAKPLLEHLAKQPAGVQSSWIGKRVASVLEFVRSRGSANELDDQLRTLADNDVMAQDSSFSLVRLIIWAIPILGFLGTVIGITRAIGGVTPETLEQSLSGVTEGLSTAFDSTALALFLTMILMFLTFVCERLEQTTLLRIDAYVDAELAHRFERVGPEASPLSETLRQGGQHLLRTAELLVEKQASLWGKSFEQMELRWQHAGSKQFEQIQKSLEHALATTLTQHAQQLRQTEEKFLARSQVLLQGLTVAAEKMQLQAEALTKLQDNESELMRLQEILNNNLAAVANTGAFDQAVQSLSAAIHLLTARVSPAPAPRLAEKKAA